MQDRKHTQVDVPANVTVVVKEIPHEAVINSGSMRVVGISDEDFIRTWSWDKEIQELSRAEKFKAKLAEIMNVKPENVDVFSVMNHPKQDKTTDVRLEGYSTVNVHFLISLQPNQINIAVCFWYLVK